MFIEFFGLRISIYRKKMSDWEPDLKAIAGFEVTVYFDKKGFGSVLHPGYTKDEPIRSVHFKLENSKENL